MKKNELIIAVGREKVQISSAAELMALLDVLDNKKDTAVIEQAGPALKTLITNCRELIDLCLLLSDENRSLLFKKMDDSLCQTIGTVGSLAHLLALLADESSENALLKVIGRKGLHILIHNSDDLALLFEWVYDSSDELLLELVGMNFILEKCKTGYEVALILQSLNAPMQKKFLNKAGHLEISKRICSVKDLAYLLRAMTNEVSEGFLKQLSPEVIRKVIRDENELKFYRTMIEAKEYHLLISKL